MQANWSLILNVLLLIGVIVAISRLMRARKLSLNPEGYQPSLDQAEKKVVETPSFNDDIIAVRKVNREDLNDLEMEPTPSLLKKSSLKSSQPRLMPQEELRESRSEARIAPKVQPRVEIRSEPVRQQTDEKNAVTSSTVMMFLLAKENRQFAGYELLQTVLASGLRFGEGHLFHRHEFANGQGSVLCSLAAATATGVFDLQNIGAFSVRGLCLFMQTSKNPGINAERFSIMLETARQLSDGLDAYLLDDQRKPLTKERIAQYHQSLNIEQTEEEYAMS